MPTYEDILHHEVGSELAELRVGIEKWIDERLLGGPADVYAANYTQLIALRKWFSDVLGGLKARLEPPSIGTARAVHRSVRMIMGLWGPVHERLLQREASDLLVWRCADDVAYSCYEPTMLEARERYGFRPRPPPLPSLSYAPSPYMLPAGALPAQFERSLGPGLDVFRATWPLPMVYLPVSCARAPWWMVMLGHEVGHQVAFDLGVVPGLALALAGAAKAAGADPSECERWSKWVHEVFADAYSVLTMGVPAIRALFELVHDMHAVMQRRYDTYPPAIIRLQLMLRFATALKLDLGGAVPVGFDVEAIAAGNYESRRDLGVVDSVVAVLCGPLPGLVPASTLPELCRHGRVPHPLTRQRRTISDQFAAYVAMHPLPVSAVAAARLAAHRDETLRRVVQDAPGGLRHANPAADCTGIVDLLFGASEVLP